MNQVVYIGLAKPSNNTIMERSTLFKPEYATRWAQYDPKLANKFLDEIGLIRRDKQGFRLLPDGRLAIIVVESLSEETEDADALHLIGEYWKKDRRQDAGQAPDARKFPAAHFFRRGPYDGLCRRGDRDANTGHQPQGVRADHARRSAMAEMGHVHRVQGQAGREMRHGSRLQTSRPRQGMGDRKR